MQRTSRTLSAPGPLLAWLSIPASAIRRSPRSTAGRTTARTSFGTSREKPGAAFRFGRLPTFRLWLVFAWRLSGSRATLPAFIRAGLFWAFTARRIRHGFARLRRTRSRFHGFVAFLVGLRGPFRLGRACRLARARTLRFSLALRPTLAALGVRLGAGGKFFLSFARALPGAFRLLLPGLRRGRGGLTLGVMAGRVPVARFSLRHDSIDNRKRRYPDS